jgi:hypothetical protein
MQELLLTRMNDTWYCMSKLQLFYNSVTNVVYDVTPPVITLIGSANVNHEINSGAYTDSGATANDNIDGDVTADIVVTGDTVNVAVLGVYNIYNEINLVMGSLWFHIYI